METKTEKRNIAKELQARVNAIQGLARTSGERTHRLEPFESAFPGRVFPLGAIHEFVSHQPADAASTSGFISAVVGKLTQRGGLCLWVSPDRSIFPAGLRHFGLEPERIVFVHPKKTTDALWVTEEALKCQSLTTVIADIRDLGFTESRRLQLAAEKSGVTGFIHRYAPFSENAVACAARWKITPLPSAAGHLPGIGYSCWEVQLTKVKNGRPFSWKVSWSGQFVNLEDTALPVQTLERYTG